MTRQYTTPHPAETQRPRRSERDSECAILGSVFLGEREHIEVAAGVLAPLDFLDVRNRVIFEAMLKIHHSGAPVDAMAVISELDREGALEKVSGPAYVTGLEQYVISPGNIIWHCKRVRDCAAEHKTAADLQAISADLSGGDHSTLIQRIKSAAEDLAAKTIPAPIASANDAARRVYESILAEIETPAHRVQTGIAGYDRKTGGMTAGDLIILAARPSVGKSALAGSIECAAAEDGRRVVLFSYEMSEDQIYRRHISRMTRIDLTKLVRGPLSMPEVALVKGALEEIAAQWEYHVYSGMDSDPEKMAGIVQALGTRGKVDLIVVDYLQLMGVDRANRRYSESRNIEIGYISRGLKQMARQFNCPVLALSQLSRDIEKRGKNSKPLLSDLRDSGSLEQDADQVLFLHRIRERCRETNWMDHVDLIVAKNRQGPGCTVPLGFFGQYMKWESREREG